MPAGESDPAEVKNLWMSGEEAQISLVHRARRQGLPLVSFSADTASTLEGQLPVVSRTKHCQLS